MNLWELTIEKAQEGLRTKEFSASELVEAALRNIEELEPKLHAFLTLTPELALEAARTADERIARGEKLLALSGIPCSLKDAILVQGVPCTAGSRMLEHYIAPYDAFVSKKLKEAGAAIMGKTNMDEFGMGASTEHSVFGPTKNPADPERVAGGSSGGSAASVALGECVISLGEDTGGSIRQPASFCGVVGLKPTYGAVSRAGVIALASSLDQVGPFARTARDAEILFNVIRGKDPLDSTSVDCPYKPQTTNYKLQDLRIGVPKEYFAKGLEAGVEKAVRQAIQKFEKAGARVAQIQLPYTEYALAAYYVINMSEASANLARYDGVRYGLHQEESDLLQEYLDSRGAGLGKEVKRRIMLGTYALSAGYYEAYYLKAQKVRSLLKQDFDKAFTAVDVIMGPTSPVLPFRLGERIQDPLAMYLVDAYTVPANVVGLPAISLPAGRVGNLPVGLQVMAPAFAENLLFELGKTFENL
ncbi:MAG: glutaminyl-tRNA synthase (glutamine-hydrolyzing) subunit A [Candidatus Wildermuthbacteria bacterium RIFCSPHIGHO2_01_FULL_49_22b]|uniref:Glutamyl-tRNA(Gln) amidotransferase subunit A n=1 Tax=Candidatus Wildermuthbacteria bacterium RIFCSPHIGHO2_01_FULL_49_22b TaxID=1802448 RepID=A0A1G2QWB1_9BACT|nr:MAG: glutaminyl-tRNA synthase (glutamine-hydrolyzing) subunit A [Candidatus Wildermuthbacteria bacterium RIFCSPHIGHO2_01_FULL_49_22b]